MQIDLKKKASPGAAKRRGNPFLFFLDCFGLRPRNDGVRQQSRSRHPEAKPKQSRNCNGAIPQDFIAVKEKERFAANYRIDEKF
jgi:hypothetical protein